MFPVHKGKKLKARGEKIKPLITKKIPQFTYCNSSLRLGSANCYLVEIYYIPKIELAYKVKLSIIAQGSGS